MKTIGLIGGMSWESTLTYYKLINTGIKQNLGGLHSAKCLLHSVDFAEIEQLQQQNRWVEAGVLLGKAAAGLQTAGADCILLCTNTMHKCASQITDAITIPFIHIATATAGALLAAGITKVGLLGTRATMQQPFYTQKLTEKGLQVLVPGPEEQQEMNRIIFEELCLGKIEQTSKQACLHMVKQLANQGAEAVILGCTEIGLLVQQADTTVPLFDTTEIHANAAVAFALQ
ncbi:aspartate/glutamate racemase family protein [Ruminococcaceae bacterium OttesenSCG-928-A16]|nr:aspartate/glutamate racemase family protein [Ruminococcaceae bacterium OttesenSCG-928-A16]